MIRRDGQRAVLLWQLRLVLAQLNRGFPFLAASNFGPARRSPVRGARSYFHRCIWPVRSGHGQQRLRLRLDSCLLHLYVGRQFLKCYLARYPVDNENALFAVGPLRSLENRVRNSRAVQVRNGNGHRVVTPDVDFGHFRNIHAGGLEVI